MRNCILGLKLNILERECEIIRVCILHHFRYIGTFNLRFTNGEEMRDSPVYTCFFLFLGGTIMLCAEHCVFFTLLDMDEIWHVLGISRCSTCLVPEAEYGAVDASAPRRSIRKAIAAIKGARGELDLGFGHKGKAEKLLADQNLLPFHMRQWNPFLLLPHVSFSCFPMDRLHGVYVDYLLRA